MQYVIHFLVQHHSQFLVSKLFLTFGVPLFSSKILSTILYLFPSFSNAINPIPFFVGKTMEYECSWVGQGERLVDSRRKNGASKKEDNKYIPLEQMIELGLIKLVQVSYHTSTHHKVERVQYVLSFLSITFTFFLSGLLIHCRGIMKSLIFTLHYPCLSLPLSLSVSLPASLFPSKPVPPSLSLFFFYLSRSPPLSSQSVSRIFNQAISIFLFSIPSTHTHATIHSYIQQCDTRIAAANAGLDLRPLIISEIQGLFFLSAIYYSGIIMY